MIRRVVLLVATAAVAATVLVPGAGAGTEVRTALGDTVGNIPGPKPPRLKKVEDTTLAVGEGGALGGGVPTVSVQEANAAVAEAGSLAAAAATAATGVVQSHASCVPYTLHGLVVVENEFEFEVISDYVSFRMRWCGTERGLQAVAPGDGDCRGLPNDGPPYHVGVVGCWWRGGRWGGGMVSFQTGGTYEVRVGEPPLTSPVTPLKAVLEYYSHWEGPGTQPYQGSVCDSGKQLPTGWRLSDCTVTATRDW